jgi:GntR family transcriptional regulator
MSDQTISSNLARMKPIHATLTSATADALGKAIQEGVFKHGTQLPAEKDLMNMLGVSRTTLREALRSLEQLGMIQRKRGLGTFVAEKSIVKDLSSNFGISEMIRQAGMIPGSLETEVRREEASASIANSLDISEGDDVIVVDRVRTANDQPAVWSLDYFAPDFMDEEALKDYTQKDTSLYQYIRERYDMNITHGVAYLLPVIAKANIASKLQIHKGTAILCISQTDFSAANHPILFSIEYHLPDLFLFMINRKGPHW